MNHFALVGMNVFALAGFTWMALMVVGVWAIAIMMFVKVPGVRR